MNILPSEILHKVFIRVPLQQRLECMLVSRYWYTTLHTRSLLYDVEIKGDVKFKKFIDMLQLFPNCGSQVEILKLKIGRTFDKRIFCNILPNLRIFEFSNYSYNDQNQSHCSHPLENVNPNSSLESIFDELECELTRHLLMFHSCTRLRKLRLSLKCIENEKEEIFIYLKSAPALKELIMDNCKIGIEECEIIHKNAPALEALKLENAILITGELPCDVIPATSVRTLAIHFDKVRDYPDHHDWYKYMAKKYTNLESFSCRDREMININPSQLTKVYRDGMLPLYKNIGSHLNYFNAINIPIEVNAFHALDEFDLQITNFNLEFNGERPIFDQLAKSNQSKYTKSIILENTTINLPIMLQNFTSLTTIKINGDLDMWNVNLTDFFNSFPATLTSFSANFHDTNISELPTRTNNIERLSLRCNTLSGMLAESISNYFPRVNTLLLFGLVTENLNLSLPYNHFKNLTIEGRYESVDLIGFSVTNTNNSQPQFFIQKPGSEYPYSLQPVTADELQDRICINVNYATAKRLHLFTVHNQDGIIG